MKPRTLPALLLALLAGCSDGPLPISTSPPSAPLEGTLDVDIRETALVSLATTGGELRAALTLSKGYGIAPAGTALSGRGRVEGFPEADSTLYTARIDAPADATGRCGDQPISLALALHRRGKEAHVGGSLTAYCGQGAWHGRPARVLRLSGRLPLP